jgi:hypothetical protein
VGEALAQSQIVFLGREWRLVFPLILCEIAAAPDGGSRGDPPERSGRHQVDLVEQGAVLEDASADEEFSEATGIKLPCVREEAEEGGGAGGEVE